MSGLHQNGSAEALGVVRIGVYCTLLIEIWSSPIYWLADLPGEWFGAWGLAAYVPREFYLYLLNSPALWALQCGLLVLSLLLILGIRPFMPMALMTAGLFFLFDALTKGFQGFSNHGRVALLLVTGILAFFPASDAISIMGRRRKLSAPTMYAAPLLSAAFLLCFAYSLIGLHRLFAGGPEIFRDDTIITYFVRNTLRHGGTVNFDFGLMFMNNAWLGYCAKFGFLVTTVFEVLSPVCLVHHGFRRVWLCVMIPFHIATYFTMKILFLNNLFLIVLLLTEWPYLIGKKFESGRDKQQS